ncbi:DUF222 domain-containing protein [Rhodococcus sp. P1Y]|nr:DUF222 domain-containing protein [Rhodococcus sp. P1Y]
MALTNSDRRALLMRTETMTRTLFGYSHTWIADLIDQHGLDGIYGSIPEALAVLLRLSMKQSGQRILMAEQFGERTTLTGERLPPHLPATTHAAENGIIGEEHQQIIRKFFKRLGTKVDTDTAEHAEQQLVQLARDLLPDAFTVAARRLYDILDPDGDLDKESVADRTYLYLDDPDAAGLSTGRFRCDAEFRAYLEAAFSKWAKPGMCNPADTTPLIDEPNTNEPDTNSGPDNTEPSLFDTPTGDNTDSSGGDGSSDEPGDSSGDDDAVEGEDAEAEADTERAQRDRRGLGRRQHDALKTILRQMLASGQLGQHRGLPVTAVITMTLNELETATGHAITATGSTIAIRDAIRMATHAHHYLVIFDDRTGRPLHLARTKRLATPDQRIVLIAADRGCTFPGCTRPATYSQTHHIDEWADGGNTDIDTLTFGCDIHHPLVGKTDTDWATTKAEPDHPYPGRTLWHPPTTLDPHRHGTINHYHHPNEYIHPSDTPLPGMPSTQPTTNTPPPDPENQTTENPEPPNQAHHPPDTRGVATRPAEPVATREPPPPAPHTGHLHPAAQKAPPVPPTAMPEEKTQPGGTCGFRRMPSFPSRWGHNRYLCRWRAERRSSLR